MQVTFRGCPPSDAISLYLDKRASRLDRFRPRLTSCRASIDACRKHGGHHRITIEMTVKGRELVVSRDPGDCTAREDLYAAIDDAFDDAIRVLESHFAKTRSSHRRSARSLERIPG